MWRVFPAFVLLFALSGAYASGYDDFSRGVSASNRGADDQAISFFSSALAAGDLNASLQPVAYLDRGSLYLGKKDCDRALSDFSAALKLKPDYLEALLGHADASVCSNHLAPAVDDLTLAIGSTPTARLYSTRARLRYLSQDFTGAASDLEQALKLAPNDYFAIWLGFAELRAGTFDRRRFADETSQLRDSGWPHPILSLLEGDRTPESVMRAGTADNDNAKRCEADFYLAEWNLVSGASAAAKPLLQEAAAICPHNYIELEAARIELLKLH